mgnify:CR=1 FL=1
MLTYPLSKESGRSLYEQLYEGIRRDILSGTLPAHQRLPSKRALAQHLEVSVITVKNAYEQLAAEGYIYTVEKKGYYVSPLESPLPPAAPPPLVPERPAEPVFLDLATGSLDRSYFPFTVWSRLMRQTILEEDTELLRSTPYNGAPALRRAIAAHLRQFRAMDVDPEQIIIGAGSEYLMMLLTQILGTSRTIAMENPTYRQAYRVFESLGCQMKPVEMDAHGMNVRLLEESGADIAYVMPSHQYPMGVVMPVKRRQELLSWAGRGEKRYLIEDDYDSEFRYRGKPVPALQGMDIQGKVIYMGTFSKSIAPAIRVGYLVLPAPLLAVYKRKCGFYASTVSRIDQKIIYQFLTEGHYERHLNRMRAIYKGKHDVLMSELKTLGTEFIVQGEYAGLHVLLKYRKAGMETWLVEEAAKARVGVYGISGFLIAPLADQKEKCFSTVVLGYARLNEDQIREGIRRLAAAWKCSRPCP